mgnify:CR=1 FL=1
MKKYLSLLNFKEKENSYLFSKGKNKIYVSEDFVIDYGDIKIHRKTINDLKEKQENLVVLEFVIKLLNIGYNSENIVLEKPFSLGHNAGAGYCDVQILDNKKKSWALIDCKTFGKEFNNSKEKTTTDWKKNQLLSYFLNEKDTKIVSIYTSKFENNTIQRQYDYFLPTKEMSSSKNLKDLYEKWDKIFISKGLFEEGKKPYELGIERLDYSDLRDINSDDGGYIFNQFAEILRRNIVSDKTNAFNKIFNLFICKIFDEDQNFKKSLDFQWLESDDYTSFIKRLKDLYIKGTKNYLNVDIFDSKNNLIEDDFKNLNSFKKYLKLNENTSIVSNEFEFKEIFNKKTFEENALIVKSIVQLLQTYKLKYSTKHQYLGDFFEKILDTGIKQESGQFFTPIPLASFICNSISIENIIKNKNKNKDINFLPYVIDYASGSGHFITEMISLIQKVIDELNIKEIEGGKTAVDNFTQNKENYKWCKEYVYAIEKDYRLAKTTKVNSFLNGDGDANTFCTDGLLPFYNHDYKKLLKSEKSDQNNQVFDIIVANPPYSVDNFKNRIIDGENNFSLYKYLSPTSDKIECLFLERAKQLLKENGIIGVIVPRSLLTTTDEINSNTRAFLLENFEIKALIKLGDKAFRKTPMRTMILFMIRKNKPNNDKILIADLDPPDDKKSKKQKKLLGYEFSERRGFEGIQTFNDGILFNEEKTNDENYISYYVKKIFLGENLEKYFKNSKSKNDKFKDILLYLDFKKFVSKDGTFSPFLEEDLTPNFNCDFIPLKEFILDDLISGKRPKGGTGRIEKGVLSIGGGHLGEGGELDLSSKEFVSEEYFSTCPAKWTIKKNDILITKDGARSGKTILVHNLQQKAIVNEHVFILRLKPELDYWYTFAYLYSSNFRKYINYASTKGGQGGINQPTLKSFKIPYPEIEIRQLISKKMKEKFFKFKNHEEALQFVDDIFNNNLL